MLALRTALGLKPEVIFFLTDADLMSNNDVNEILAEAGGSRIQAVEFGRGSDLGMETPLRRLATTTGGHLSLHRRHHASRGRRRDTELCCRGRNRLCYLPQHPRFLGSWADGGGRSTH